MYNPKAWITKILTLNWFHQCFIPQAKEYLHNLCIEFKVLLVMDNAGGHPLDMYYKVAVGRVASYQNHLTHLAYGSRCDPCLQGTLHSEFSPTPHGCNGLTRISQ